MAGLDALANLRRVLAEDYADVFPQEDRQALNAAIGRRETAVGEKVADLMIADIDAATDGMPAFNNIVTQTNPQLLKRLPAAEAARVRAGADATAERDGGAWLRVFEEDYAERAVSAGSNAARSGPAPAQVLSGGRRA